jgi:DNA-binding transcriptional LysR family regulator
MEEHFLVFKDVAETKNITLSAKKLLSQPSISSQMQNIENEYVVRFFDCSNNGSEDHTYRRV